MQKEILQEKIKQIDDDTYEVVIELPGGITFQGYIGEFILNEEDSVLILHSENDDIADSLTVDIPFDKISIFNIKRPKYPFMGKIVITTEK